MTGNGAHILDTAAGQGPSEPVQPDVVIGLSAVVIAVTKEQPKVLVVRRPYAPLQSASAGAHHFMDKQEELARPLPQSRDWLGLPFGPFDPVMHRTLEIGLRSWVEEQTHLQVGYVEQLYTFADSDRHGTGLAGGPQVVSVGYLALTQEREHPTRGEGGWDDWYQYFPWEDHRDGEPAIIPRQIIPRLEAWIAAAATRGQRDRRQDRTRLCFGLDEVGWDEEKVLERYELLYEAGLVAEAARDRLERLHRHAGDDPPEGLPAPDSQDVDDLARRTGAPMQFDHRRILATAMGRLRGKLKYRPVVFELMPPTFTLLALQRTVESVSGIRVHKQNFRRLVERAGLVEGTGQQIRTGGRPAEAFRFRREVLRERPAPGMRLSPVRHR